MWTDDSKITHLMQAPAFTRQNVFCDELPVPPNTNPVLITKE